MNVMLLAAGEGTRLRPYTQILPKPAIPFLNVPLAAHSLQLLQDTDIDKLVVNTFHLPEKVRELFNSLPSISRQLFFSDEQNELLGNGGGLGKAQSHFLGGGDFILMNSDEVILPQHTDFLSKAMAQHKANKALATLIVMDYPGVGSKFGGVWCKKEGQVLGFGKNALPGSEYAWHFIGVQILSERIFSFIPPSGPSNILYDAVAVAIQKGHLVQTYPISCSWYETGNPVDFLHASSECFNFLSSSQVSHEKSFLLKTLDRFSGEPFEIKNTGHLRMLKSESSQVSSQADLSGLIVAGARTQISEGCRLKNVILGNSAHLNGQTEATDKIFL